MLGRLNRYHSHLRYLFSLDSRPDLYKLLELEPKATPKQIEYNYYRLLRKYKPDGVENPEAHTKLLNQAFIILSNPTQRQKYDEKHGHQSSQPDEETGKHNKNRVGASDSHQKDYARFKKERSTEMGDEKEQFQNKVLLMVAVLAGLSTLMLVAGKLMGGLRGGGGRPHAMGLPSDMPALTAEQLKARQMVIKGEGH